MSVTLPTEKRQRSGAPTETGWWYGQTVYYNPNQGGKETFRSNIHPKYVEIFKKGTSRVDRRMGCGVDGDKDGWVKYRWFGPVTVVEE